MARAAGRFDFPGFLLVAYIDARAGHGLDHTIVFQLAVDLADGVAVQARLHRQLAGAGQPVTGWKVTRRDRETDLVVELGRRGNVALLLDMKTHAWGVTADRPCHRSGTCPA